MSDRRLAITLLVISAVIVAGIVGASLWPEPETIQESVGDATIYLHASDTSRLSDIECVGVTWQVERIQTVELDDRPVVGSGSDLWCDRTLNLRVRFTDDTERSFSIRKTLWGEQVAVRLGFVLAAVMAYAGIALLAPRHEARRPEPSQAKGWIIFALILITLMGVAARTANLSNSLRFDESWTVIGFASLPIDQALTTYSSTNNHLFLTALIHIATNIFGLIPWAMRLPVYWAGILLIPVVYQAARSIYGPSVGILAAALVAVASQMVEWSVNARGYMLGTLFFVAGLWVATLILQRSAPRRWIVLVLLNVLALYTVPTMLTGVGIVGAWLFGSAILLHRGAERAHYVRWTVGSFVAVGLVSALLYLPALLYIQSHDPATLDLTHLSETQGMRSLRHSVQAALTQTWAYWIRNVPDWLSVALIGGFLFSLLLHRRVSGLPLHPAFLAGLVTIVLLYLQSVTTYARLWVFLLPIVLMACVAGWVGLARIVSVGRPPALVRGVIALAIGLAVLQGARVIQSDAVERSIEGGREIGAEEAILAIRSVRQDEPVICAGLCLSYELYGLIHGVPVLKGYGPETAPPMPNTSFFFVGLYDSMNELQPSLEFMGYSIEGTMTATEIWHGEDSRVYKLDPLTEE